MVGHSQLDSDMLETTPASLAADETDSKAAHAAADEADDKGEAAAGEASVTEDEADDKAEAGSGSDEEDLQAAEGTFECQPAPQPSPLPVPQPGRKRKRSGPQCCHAEEAVQVTCLPADDPTTYDPTTCNCSSRLAILVC